MGLPTGPEFQNGVAVESIVMPTKHQIYPLDTTGQPRKEILIVSIEIDNVRFGLP